MKKKKTKNIFKKSLVMGLSLLSVLSSFSNFATAVYAEGESASGTADPTAETGDPTSTPEATPETTPEASPTTPEAPANDGDEDPANPEEPTAPTSVDTVALTIEAPVTDATLATTGTADKDGVSIDAIKYFIDGTESTDTVASPSTTYSASITLSTTDEYVFAEGLTVTVNGANAETKVNEDKTATVSYTFAKTEAKEGVIGLTTDSPVAGQYVKAEATCDNTDVTIGAVEWKENGASFNPVFRIAANTVYSVTVRVTSNSEDIKFKDDGTGYKVTINGQEATLNVIDENNADATITFEQTGLIKVTVTAKDADQLTGADNGSGVALDQFFNIDPNAGEQTYYLDENESTGIAASFLSSGKIYVTQPGTFKVTLKTAAYDDYEAAEATAVITLGKVAVADFTKVSESGTVSNALELYKWDDIKEEDNIVYSYDGNGNLVATTKMTQSVSQGLQTTTNVIRSWMPAVGTWFGEELGAEIIYENVVSSNDEPFAINFRESYDPNGNTGAMSDVTQLGAFNVMTVNSRKIKITVTFYRNVDKTLRDTNGEAVTLETKAQHLFYGGFGLTNETNKCKTIEWTAPESSEDTVYATDAMPEKYYAYQNYLDMDVYYSTDATLTGSATGNPATNAEYVYDAKGKTSLTYYVGFMGQGYTTFHPTVGDPSIWFRTDFLYVTSSNALYTLEIDPNGGIYKDKTGENMAYQYNGKTKETDSWFIEDAAYETDGISIPTREGYAFDGWTVVKGPGTLNDDQSEYTFGAGNGKIVAQWRHYSIFTEVINGTITKDGTGAMTDVDETGEGQKGEIEEIMPGENRTVTYEPKSEYYGLSYIEVSSRNSDGTWNDPEKVSIEDFESKYDFTDINCDYKIKVVYEPAQLTIHYLEKDTNYVLWQDAHVLTKGKGDTYSVESPDIQGYTVYAEGESQKVVQGTMPANTYEVTVYYEKDPMIGSDITVYVNASPYSGNKVVEGDTITYTITAQNTGVQGPQDTTATIQIPTGTTFQQVTATSNANIQTSYDANTNVLTVVFPQVTRGTGQTASFTVTVNSDDKFHDEKFVSPIYEMATWHTDKDTTERESNLTVHYMNDDVKGPASLYVQKASTTLTKRTITTSTKYDISGSATNTLSNGRGADHPTNVKMGSFTAPEDGTYHFEIVGHSATKNGQSSWGTYYGATVEFDLELKAGDTIYGLAGWGRSEQMDNKISRVLGGGGGNGEKGGGANGYNGTGGGASFIATSNLGEIQNYYSNSTNKSNIIAIAGGAGIGGSALGFATLGNSPQAGEQGGGGATGGSSKKPGTSYQAGTITINGRSVALQNVTFSNSSLNGDAHIYVYHTSTQTYYDTTGGIDPGTTGSGSTGGSTSANLSGTIRNVEVGIGLVNDPTNYVNAASFTAPQDGTYHVVVNGGYTADGTYIYRGAKVEFDIQLQAGDTVYGIAGYHTWLNDSTKNVSRTVNGGGAGGGGLPGSGASSLYIRKVGNGEIINYANSKDAIIAVAGGAGRSGVGQGVVSSGTFGQGATGSGGGYYGGTNGNGGSSYVASSVTTNGHSVKISNVSIIAGGRQSRSNGSQVDGANRNYDDYGVTISYKSSDYDNDFLTAADKSNGIINYARTSSTTSNSSTTNNIDTTITYNITFKNDGAEIAKNVVLRDVIPAGTDYVEGSLKVISDANTSSQKFNVTYDSANKLIYVSGTELKQGDIITFTFDVAVNGESGLIQNQVDFDRDVTLSQGKTATLKHKSNIVEHKLKGKIVVTKDWVDDEESDRPASITAHLVGSDGTNLTASLTAANNWTYTFDVNYSKGVTYNVYEDEVDLYESNATASNPIVVGEYNSATLRNTYMPNFNVSKDVKNANGVSIDGEYVKVNDELTYEITISNPTSKTKYYDVEDVVPTNTTYKSGGTSYDANTRTVTFSNVAVEANSSATVSFKVTVNSDAKKATIVNKANVWLLRSNGTRVEKRKQETNEVTNYTTYDTQFVKDVTTLDGDSIDKTYLNAGDEYYYTITVENFAKEAKDFTITDKLPEEVTFVEADNNGTHANGTVTWNVNVASGKSATVKVKVRVNDDVKNALIENIANVAVDHVDQDTNKVENKAAIIVIDKEVNIASENDMYFVFNLQGSNGVDLAAMVEVKAKETTGRTIVNLPSYTSYEVIYTISEKDGNGCYTCKLVNDITEVISDEYGVNSNNQANVTINNKIVKASFDKDDVIAGIYVFNEVTLPTNKGKLNVIGK